MGQLFPLGRDGIFLYQVMIGPLYAFAFYYFCKSTILQSFLAGLFIEIVPVLLRVIANNSYDYLAIIAYSIPLVLAPLIAFKTLGSREHLLKSLLYISLGAGLSILVLHTVNGDANVWIQSVRSAILWFCYASFFFRPPLAAHEKAKITLGSDA
jgi:hypothetical protein